MRVVPVRIAPPSESRAVTTHGVARRVVWGAEKRDRNGQNQAQAKEYCARRWCRSRQPGRQLSELAYLGHLTGQDG